MSKHGYHSYRGRRSAGRIAVVAVLVVVLAAACAFLFLQRYITYADDGSVRLELPFFAEEAPPAADGGGQGEGEPSPDMNLVVEQTPAADPAEESRPPQAEALPAHRLVELHTLPADEQALRAVLDGAGANGFVYTVRDNTGRVFYDSSAAIRSAAVGAPGSGEQLSRLCQAEGVVSVARLNCFHDSYYAWVNMESAGICQSNGYIWYDNISYHWLDPAKEQTRDYVIGLALECAQLGFDELLLEQPHYPAEGKLSRIDYSGSPMGKTRALELFMEELRQALEGYDITLTLLVPEGLLGEDAAAFTEASGLVPEQVLPLFDALCIETEDPAYHRAALDALQEDGAALPVIPITASTEGQEHWILPASR